MKLRSIAILSALSALAACATPTPPVNVTRFHLNQPIERGTVLVEPAPGGNAQGLEFGAYAAAVTEQLQRNGYVRTDALGRSLYVAVVDVQRGVRPATVSRGSPVTIGVGGGGGSFGRGGGFGGLGGGISFGLGGGGRNRDVVATQMSVTLKRRSDQQVMWEGRAIAEAREDQPAAQPGIAAQRLADALFRDFPGVSGRTISVP